MADLQATIAAAKDDGVEGVVIGTPIDLARLIDIPLPSTRVRYEFQSLGEPSLAQVLDAWLDEMED